MKTAAEIKALQVAAGTYKEPAPLLIKDKPLTDDEASTRYHQRLDDLRSRLRRYSSVSLLQRLELKRRAVTWMGGCCILCGYCKCMRALEFHHRERENKQFSIATFIGAKVFEYSVEEVWTQVVEELKKCVLLCANCHREVEDGIVDLPNNQ
jgi:hypothetical protein